MIADAADLPSRTEIRADICIVGSGAAGITLALKLVANGRSILLLESSAKDVIRTDTEETARALQANGVPVEFGFWRQNRLYDPQAQHLNGGSVSAEMATFDAQFLKWSRVRAYGGTTNCWDGWTRPLDAVDFDRSDLGIAWPISREALYPHYYNEAMQICSMPGIGVERYDDEMFWARRNDSAEFLNFAEATNGAMRNALYLIANRRAWSFQQVWGPELECAPNCHILRNANVRAIVAGAGGSVDHLLVSSIANQKHAADFTVKADQYVLATGGTEGARLLLYSASGGFANRHDWLGRCFQIHPLNASFAEFTQGRRPPSQRTIDFYSRSTLVDDGELSPSLLLAVAPSEATLRRFRMRNFRAILRLDTGQINLNWEQAPNPESRVLLSTTEKDSFFGDPLTHLEWRSSPADTGDTPDRAMKLVTDMLQELGLARRVMRTGRTITWAGDHHMGATRMSARPEDGYVDPNCRVHGVDNLYIASSSVFPTSGHANPTLTIIALAARLADHLAERSRPYSRSAAPA